MGATEVLTRPVDAHDVRAEVGQQHRREGHGTDPSDLDHGHVRERSTTGTGEILVRHDRNVPSRTRLEVATGVVPVRVRSTDPDHTGLPEPVLTSPGGER
ncbi:hypothetical protein GCM10009867_26680 [Pedococcus aerophilus]|uniref:Uncharacterized protein n=1 Tax=Pedococcus aerophilus TaxID=436356 RepID=A0ABP6H8T3_9MICO